MELFPRSILYEPYLASPLEPRFKLSRLSVSDVGIPETSSKRWELKAGRTIGLLRFNHRWQVNVFGGFMASFDVEHSTDSIAWDGLFGAQLVRRFNDRSLMKLGYAHQSAHRGDEFLQRTGRNRIDYTRQEVNFGFSHSITDLVRTYLELGWGTTLRNEGLQEAGRWQAGIEYGIPSGRHVPSDGGQWGLYAAGDVESMEERDWQVDTSLSGGVYLLKGLRLWRVGLEYRNGRSPYGEFFRRDESYWGISFWNDFL